MRIQCDTLKYANLLKKRGVEAGVADKVMSTVTQVDILNIHDKDEVTTMLNESTKAIFAEQDKKLAEQSKKLAEQRREFDARRKETARYHEQQLRDNKAELLTSRRWMIGSVITVGVSLATYLSALLHFIVGPLVKTIAH